LSYRFDFGTAILAATLLAPVGMAQTTSPELVPKVSAATWGWKAPDFKPAGRGWNSDTVFIKPKAIRAARYSNKQVLVLSMAVYGAALADMHQTLEARKNSWWFETDPLAKPFVRLPAPAYYAAGLAMATGLNWLSWRMGHSRRFRMLAPVSQLLAIAGNIYGFRTNHF
jgi:hypothetical protein